MQPLLSFLRGGTTRPNAAPLRITLARRLVETPGAPFVTSEEVFRDIASARDELGLLSASQGPTVVRVQGGTTAARKDLAGDWLVDPDAPQRIARLPMPRWTYSSEATEWARARPWLEAWETCQDARWMLEVAGVAGVEQTLLVLAACACARSTLRFLPAGEVRPLHALEAAERWARGEARREEVRSAAADAAEAATTAITGAAWAAADAADAAGWSACSADAASAASPAAAAAASAASAAVSEVDEADDAVRTAAMAPLADLVRRVIPTLTMLRAVALPL